jgi:hypothetical protein
MIFNEIANLFSDNEEKRAILQLAEKQCALLRIRQARQAALDAAFSKNRFSPSLLVVFGVRDCQWLVNFKTSRGASAEEILEFLAPEPLSPIAKQYASIKEVMTKIERFDRYERRAHSALRTAIRQLQKKRA